MEFLSHPVSAVLLLLGALIIVHEAGHYLAGKMCGIAVEIFSIGFGPSIVRFTYGETSYRLSLIPLGGFVKFFGSVKSEPVPESAKGREFYRASLIKRVITVAAGPLANFLLAIAVYTGMGWHGISQPPPIIGEILADSPAEKAGFQFGDWVTRINETPIKTWRDLREEIVKAPGQSLTFIVKRKGKEEVLTVTPHSVLDKNMLSPQHRGQVGISPLHVSSHIRVGGKGIGAALGLKTGDKVVALIGPDKDQKVPIQYWRQLQEEVERIAQSGAQGRLALEISRPTDNPKEETAQTLTFQLPKLQPSFTMSALGIFGGHLTVNKSEELKNLPLAFGDVILKWNDQPVRDIFALKNAMGESRNPMGTARILRQDQELDLSIPLKPVEVQRPEGKVTIYTLPISFIGELLDPKPVTEQYKNPFNALAYGIEETGKQTAAIALAVYGLMTGDVPLKALGGPISIAKVASESVKLGWMTFLSALSLISINLGLLNLFPIPVLDGGQLVLLAAEGVKRKPLSEGAVENFQKVGFVMIFSLIIMATYNDLGRFWSSILKGLTGFFQ